MQLKILFPFLWKKIGKIQSLKSCLKKKIFKIKLSERNIWHIKEYSHEKEMSACHIHDSLTLKVEKQFLTLKKYHWLLACSHINLQISFIVITRKHFSTMSN